MVRYQNQDDLFFRLKQVFGESNVIMEWDVAKESQDAYTRALYCPRIDFAIGPFNIDTRLENNNYRITQKYEEYEPLLNSLVRQSDTQNNNLKGNDNPRCFLTIEHENNVSRKHMVGTIINASAIGKVGIVIAAQDKTYRALVRIRKYLDALVKFDKLNYSPENIIIIQYDKFMLCMEEYVNRQGV